MQRVARAGAWELYVARLLRRCPQRPGGLSWAYITGEQWINSGPSGLKWEASPAHWQLPV